MIDQKLKKLTRSYYAYLEDQLYDPDPDVDGYDKEHQKKHVIETLEALAEKAAEIGRQASDDTCRLCSPDMRFACADTDYSDGYQWSCTRPAGHKGNHVACSPGFGKHRLAEWENWEDEEVEE